MLDRADLVPALDDVVGAGHRGVDVAEADLAERASIEVEGVDAPLGHRRCAGSQRLFHVEHRRQFLVFDAHELGRLGRPRSRLGDHGDDRLADVAHALVGENALLVEAEADQAEDGIDVFGHVRRSERANETGDLLGATARSMLRMSAWGNGLRASTMWAMRGSCTSSTKMV